MKLFAFKDCISKDFIGFFTCPNLDTALRESVAVVKKDKGIASDPVSFALFYVGELGAESNSISFDGVANDVYDVKTGDKTGYSAPMTYICRLSDVEAKYAEVLNGINA